MKYRPEIDGLRAVAVVGVVVYHLKIAIGDTAVLPGGFLGVDVFFVISGYLITAIILQEIEATGRFSVLGFYERRARRILPALFAVMAVSLPVALWILLPGELESFARSLLASTFFVSNHFWHLELAAYGAQSSLLQPFVHTWSLAVEEQFYILFPPVLWLITRQSRVSVGWLLLMVVVLGLCAAQLASLVRPSLSFFWLPSRAWELLAGALVAWASLHRPDLWRGLALARLAPGLGLGLVLGSMLLLDLSHIRHPGLATVPSVAGTCMMIWFARPDEAVTRLLSARIPVAVGLISYSLYLWHYPIFAFGRQLDPAPGLADKGLWVLLAVGLSVLTWRYVERPFRQRGRIRRARVATGAGLAACTVMAVAAVVQAGQGFPQRFPRLAVIYGENEFDNAKLRDLSWSVLDTLAQDETVSRNNAYRPSRYAAEKLWFSHGASTRVLVVGNSHSKDVFNALYLNADRFAGYEFAHFTLGSRLHPEQIDALLASPNFEAADIVLVSFRFAGLVDGPDLPALLDRLQGRGKRVVMTTNTVEFQQIGGLPVFDWATVKSMGAMDDGALARLAWQYRARSVEEVNAELARIAQEKGVDLLPLIPLLCDEHRKACALTTPEGRKAYYDYGHLTLEGAQFLGRRMAEERWLSGKGIVTGAR